MHTGISFFRHSICFPSTCKNGADEREIAMEMETEIGKSVKMSSAARMDEFISTLLIE